jgi:glucokinase
MVNLLAGDVGGTTTRLGLYEKTAARPRRLASRDFRTLDFPDLPSMIDAFLRIEGRSEAPLAAACFGVAGPVTGERATLTNIPWRVDAAQVARAHGLARVRLLNDLEAMAYAVPVLEDDEVHVLHAGRPRSAGDGSAGAPGNIAVIAAGTGLGEAFLHLVDGRHVAAASEGGHADFAARTDRDVVVLRDLTARLGRAQVEDVVSGRGLVNIHRAIGAAPCDDGIDLDDANAPSAITTGALARRCEVCVESLSLFVEAYGAEAGNHALRTLATGGVFIGGGIAPKILPALADGRFMSAFRAKAPFEALLDAIPVKVIVSDAGLLGAANFCSRI